MRRVLLGIALLASPAMAQTGAYKLVVSWPQSGTVVIDYPTEARCQHALAVLEADYAKRVRRSQENAQPGTITIGSPFTYVGVCIPA